jgi:hypothetical protein
VCFACILREVCDVCEVCEVCEVCVKGKSSCPLCTDFWCIPFIVRVLCCIQCAQREIDSALHAHPEPIPPLCLSICRPNRPSNPLSVLPSRSPRPAILPSRVPPRLSIQSVIQSAAQSSRSIRCPFRQPDRSVMPSSGSWKCFLKCARIVRVFCVKCVLSACEVCEVCEVWC